MKLTDPATTPIHSVKPNRKAREPPGPYSQKVMFSGVGTGNNWEMDACRCLGHQLRRSMRQNTQHSPGLGQVFQLGHPERPRIPRTGACGFRLRKVKHSGRNQMDKGPLNSGLCLAMRPSVDCSSRSRFFFSFQTQVDPSHYFRQASISYTGQWKHWGGLCPGGVEHRGGRALIEDVRGCLGPPRASCAL